MAAGLAAAATVGARAEPEAISVSVKYTVYIIMYNAFRAIFHVREHQWGALQISRAQTRIDSK